MLGGGEKCLIDQRGFMDRSLQSFEVVFGELVHVHILQHGLEQVDDNLDRVVLGLTNRLRRYPTCVQGTDNVLGH